MASGDSIFWGFAAFIVGIVFFFSGFGVMKKRNTIANIPKSKVRSIAMGLVEVNGKALQGNPLKSPFSNKKCVYYKYMVEEYVKRNKNSYWRTVAQKVSDEYFYLQDETGTVLIDPRLAELDLKPDAEFRSNFGRDPPEQVMNFLKEQNISFEGLFGANKKMRYREWFIAPEDALYIIGTAVSNPFNKDSANNDDKAMIKRDKDELFMISDSSENSLLKKLKWQLAGCFGLGGLICTIGLAVMLLNLGLL